MRTPAVAMILLMLLSGCRKPEEPRGGAEGRDGKVSSAKLLLERTAVRPGETVGLGVLIELAPGWHTYADPPGDSGMAPILSLVLPEGVQAAPLEYPPHREFEDAAGTTYGYEGRVLLRVPLTVSAKAESPGELSIAAAFDYLVCKDLCLPQQAKSNLVLNIAPIASEPAPEWRRAMSEGGWAGNPHR